MGVIGRPGYLCDIDSPIRQSISSAVASSLKLEHDQSPWLAVARRCREQVRTRVNCNRSCNRRCAPMTPESEASEPRTPVLGDPRARLVYVLDIRQPVSIHAWFAAEQLRPVELGLVALGAASSACVTSRPGFRYRYTFTAPWRYQVALTEHRPFTNWMLVAPTSVNGRQINEAASVPMILETLTTHAEIAAVGRERFPGTLKQRNALWRDFRNYMRQALSNFAAAQTVPNRSAALLYYYSMLNFAKAELLDSHASAIVNTRIGHGLSFSPTAAKTVLGDSLTVVNGVFPMLYERRMGKPIRIGQRLPVGRLLAQVPEISYQLNLVNGGKGQVAGIYQALVLDGSEAWSFIAMTGPSLHAGSVTDKYLRRHYQQVQEPSNWKEIFGFSREYLAELSYFESRRRVPYSAGGPLPADMLRIIFDIQDILGLQSNEQVDAWIAPSLYKTRMLPMVPALARYALTFYASSLVRYKPQMFDGQLFPDQAYLFDAIARELAMPMLQDTLSAIEGATVLFRSSTRVRS